MFRFKHYETYFLIFISIRQYRCDQVSYGFMVNSMSQICSTFNRGKFNQCKYLWSCRYRFIIGQTPTCNLLSTSMHVYKHIIYIHVIEQRGLSVVGNEGLKKCWNVSCKCLCKKKNTSHSLGGTTKGKTAVNNQKAS